MKWITFNLAFFFAVGGIGLVGSYSMFDYMLVNKSADVNVNISDNPLTAEISKVPLNKYAKVFVQKGKYSVFVGNSTILFRVGNESEWQLATGGNGKRFVSYDGGLNFSQSYSGLINVSEVCSVEGAAISTDLDRLFIRSSCDHSSNIWSVPLASHGAGGKEEWYVHGFTSPDGSNHFAPDFDFTVVGSRIMIRSLTDGGSRILVTDDAGLTWSSSVLDRSRVTDLCFITPEMGWVIIGNRTVERTVDGGRTWSTFFEVPILSGDHLNALDFSETGNGYVVGASGLILATKDGGDRWEKLRGVPNIDWYQVMLSHSNVWVSGRSDLIIGSKNNGSTWRIGKAPNGRKIFHEISISQTGEAVLLDDDLVYRYSL